MSPNPNTDYDSFIFSVPKYISASPTTARPVSNNTFASGSSMPPTAPNTMKNPNMNLIIYIPLLLNAAIIVVNVSLAITTKSASRRPTSAGNATTITINSIHFIILSSQHVSCKIFPLFIAGTYFANCNKGT